MVYAISSSLVEQPIRLGSGHTIYHSMFGGLDLDLLVYRSNDKHKKSSRRRINPRTAEK